MLLRPFERIPMQSPMRLLLRLHLARPLIRRHGLDCVELAGQDLPLRCCVNAVDLVVVLVSTVAVQATFGGLPCLASIGSDVESLPHL